MPKYGYTKMFERMLAHKNIKILLQTDYREIIDNIKFNQLIFTGPIDEFFDYQFGELPYRSLDFSFQVKDNEYYQEVGTVNYPNNYEFTRITEMKYLTGQQTHNTTICIEYPRAFTDRVKQVRYYPIPRTENNELFQKYLGEAHKLKNIFFAGRLADYKYYNMDQVVARALSVFEKEVAKP
jgi:UDP-galactopyranose mutase